jgi:hypothetical protein
LGSHILEANNYRGASYTWRSIAKAAVILTSGFTNRVGKGDISIWYDKWLHNGRICDRISSVDEEDTRLHIMDVCSYDTILTSFPPIFLKRSKWRWQVYQVHIRIWEPFVSGTYSTKSAYSWLTLVYNPPQIQTMTWSWIWNLKLPKNIRHFVWIIMHGKLLTNCTLVIFQRIPLVIDVVQLMKPSYTPLEIAQRPCKFGTVLIFHPTLIFIKMICIIG